MIVNSVGNVTEVLNLLDKDAYTPEEIVANYQMLVDRWGEWTLTDIVLGGLSVRYIDIGAAMFSGAALLYAILSATFLLIYIVFGKITLPLLAKMYANNNVEMVDIATLKTASQIDQIHKSKKEWF